MSNPYESPHTDTATPPPTAATGMHLGPTAILFSLEGRISRRVFWTYTAPLFVVWAGGSAFSSAEPQLAILWAFPLIVVAFYAQVALAIKRLHDRNRSGWWLMFGLVPIVGWVWIAAEVGFRQGD